MKTGIKLFLAMGLFAFVSASKKIEVVTFSELQKQTEAKKNDTLYVLNFWATWCRPSEFEIPIFEEASAKFGKEKIKILYVSINHTKEIAGVERFIKNKKLQNQVVLLSIPSQVEWIEKVDAFWTGSIPATVMYKNGKAVFFKEGGITQEELHAAITNKTRQEKPLTKQTCLN